MRGASPKAGIAMYRKGSGHYRAMVSSNTSPAKTSGHLCHGEWRLAGRNSQRTCPSFPPHAIIVEIGKTG